MPLPSSPAVLRVQSCHGGCRTRVTWPWALATAHSNKRPSFSVQTPPHWDWLLMRTAGLSGIMGSQKQGSLKGVELGQSWILILTPQGRSLGLQSRSQPDKIFNLACDMDKNSQGYRSSQGWNGTREDDPWQCYRVVCGALCLQVRVHVNLRWLARGVTGKVGTDLCLGWGCSLSFLLCLVLPRNVSSTPCAHPLSISSHTFFHSLSSARPSSIQL